MNYSHLRPLIFRFPPEWSHTVSLRLLRLAGQLPPAAALVRALFSTPGPRIQPARVFGLDFSNPIGMAAGYDKDALAWRGLALLGFGHIELGTVTPLPQPGNPGRRVFRLVEDRAVINRMGFPSQGAERVARRLQRAGRQPGVILGANLGKNKDTPLEEACGDYLQLLRAFAPLVDYLVINVSSPNTPGLLSLQSRSSLEALLEPLVEERDRQSHALRRPVPLLLKISPDLGSSELDGVLAAALTGGIDGLIAANTSLSRTGLRSPNRAETGGLSGAPLRERNTALIRDLVHRLGPRASARLPVVASGGILEPRDALEKLDAGAALVQLYTGLIYSGPGLVRQILSALDCQPVARRAAVPAGSLFTGD